VAKRSPTPARPMKVSVQAPIFRPRVVISWRPRARRAPLVLSSEAEAVGHAGADGEDVFEGAGQFYAGDV